MSEIEDEIEALRAENRTHARQLALKRLGRRESSRLEMVRYLVGKKVSSETAESVVETLVSDGLIDDMRYARMMIREQMMRGKGPIAIRMKLRVKGVAIEVAQIREWIQEMGGEGELEAARKIVERRYPKAREDRKEASRAFQALLRRGFSAEIAREAIFKGAPSSNPLL